MSPNILAILTIIIIGIGAFLLGWLLTTNKWKQLFLEEERKRKVEEGLKKHQITLLDASIVKEKNLHKRLLETEELVRNKELTLRQLRKTITTNVGKTANQPTGEAYNKLLNELTEEKKRVQALEDQIIKYTTSKNKVQATEDQSVTYNTSKKRVSISTYQAVPTQQILPPPPGSSLTTILKRMSVFTNLNDQDDLTEIQGISEKISQKLQNEGIQNFKQIAMLEKKDLVLIGKVTGLDPSAILAQNWIEKARDLYHKKYKVDL